MSGRGGMIVSTLLWFAQAKRQFEPTHLDDGYGICPDSRCDTKQTPRYGPVESLDSGDKWGMPRAQDLIGLLNTN